MGFRFALDILTIYIMVKSGTHILANTSFVGSDIFILKYYKLSLPSKYFLILTDYFMKVMTASCLFRSV